MAGKRWIERLARVGFAAKGVVYAVVGGLAAMLATGQGGRATGSGGALSTIGNSPFGSVALVIVAVGLVGYAVWRLVEAVEDPRGRGNDMKGFALRTSSAAKGLAYGYLGVEAALMLMRGMEKGSDDSRAQHWTAQVLAAPFGRAALMTAALALIAYGIYQLINALRAKLSRDLALGSIPSDTRRAVIAVSRFGIAARGVVFLLIGWFGVQAALQQTPQQARGVAGALRSVAGMYGSVALAIIGIGLVAYGIYELVNARYRQIVV